MKKINKILSVLLAVVIVCSIVPFSSAVYVNYEEHNVVDKNGDEYTYFTDGSQYVRKGTQNNEYLNVWADNACFFMLTEPSQKFVFEQDMRLQCAYRLSGSSICFNEIVYYTGQSLEGTVDEYPSGENNTEALISQNGLNVSWAPNSELDTKGSAQKMIDEAISAGSYVEGVIPWGYEFEVSFVNVSGNTNYYWRGTSSFEATEAMDTSFYYALSWYDEVDDRDSNYVTNQAIFETKIKVTDVREVISKVEEYKEIVNNPEGYTQEQVEQYKEYIDNIPEGMLDGTKYYSQEQVDTVYDYITGEIDGLADTEEYMYYRMKALEIISKNDSGEYKYTDIYTNQSLQNFEEQFNSVDIGGYFPYPASRQSEVDSATAELKGLFNNLAGVNTNTQTSEGTNTDTVWDSENDTPSGDSANPKAVFTLTNNSYKYVQVSDNQQFSFSQELKGVGKNISYSFLGTPRPYLESFTFDTACDGTNCTLDENSAVKNNTTEFIKHLDSSNVSVTDGVTNYKGWTFNSRSGDNQESFTITNGILQQTKITTDTHLTNGTTYHTLFADAVINFSGNENEVDSEGNRIVRDSEIDLSFYWKLTSSIDSVIYHAHIPVEILITDLRPIISLYDELYKFAYFASETENRTEYTSESVEAVKTALSVVPEEMICGTKYYTQTEVNDYYNALVEAKNNLVSADSLKKADYTALDKAIADAEEILNNTETNYTDGSKNELVAMYNAAVSAERDLPLASQGVIDELADNLNDAIEGIKVKADYTLLDEAIANAKDALNKTGSNYTESSKEAVEDALLKAENINRDLSTEEEDKITEVVNELTSATQKLTDAADLTRYKEAKNEADDIIAAGNENGRYDEADWNKFIEAVQKAEEDIGLNIRDIPKTEQDRVDEVTDSLINSTTELLNNRYIFISFKTEGGEVVKLCKVKFANDLTFASLEQIPELPENTGFVEYFGWYYKTGAIMNQSDAITDDLTLHYVAEEKKIVSKSDSNVLLDRNKFLLRGLGVGTTVEELLASLDNDINYIVIKDSNGNVVSDESVIATGMTVELMSKTDNTKINEKITIVVSGDVNGDGVVNETDIEQAADKCLKNTYYTDEEKAYFAANDTNDDGVLDVFDLFNIGKISCAG